MSFPCIPRGRPLICIWLILFTSLHLSEVGQVWKVEIGVNEGNSFHGCTGFHHAHEPPRLCSLTHIRTDWQLWCVSVLRFLCFKLVWTQSYSDQTQSRISGRATNKLWQLNLTRKDCNYPLKTPQEINTQRLPETIRRGRVNYTQVRDVKMR